MFVTMNSRALGAAAAVLLGVLALAPAPAAAQYTCDQLLTYFETGGGANYWWGAFGNCRGKSDRAQIFECAWNQLEAQYKDGSRGTCLKEKLRNSARTRQGIDAVVVNVAPPANAPPAAPNCDAVVAYFETGGGANYWWGAFGNCKRAGGTTDRDQIYECAWNQLEPQYKSNACLKAKLKQGAQTRNGIDAVVAFNKPPPAPTCEQRFAYYEGSNWWWGAFGNCKKAAGTTDRNQIFDCAWNQITTPADKANACLKGKLQTSASTKNGIDAVVAFNSGVGKKGFGEVCFQPSDCVSNKCVGTCQADKATAPKGSVAANYGPVNFTGPEACEPRDVGGKAVTPPGYFAPLMPRDLVDAPVAANQFNNPAGRNIGTNEGRVHPRLRLAARFKNPLTCSLPLSAISFSLNDEKFGRAFADLSVTGRAAFAEFKKLPANYCQTIQTRVIQLACHCVNPQVPGGCKTPAAPSPAALALNCQKTLDRAYKVANFLRTGQALRVKGAWFNANGSPSAALLAERQRKAKERNDLGWIAVSGEDDQPHRPVNVGSSEFQQYEIDVDVPAPRVATGKPKTVRVHTRYVIAHTGAPAPLPKPAGKWSLVQEPSKPTLAANAEVFLFIHGMDSRAEEANDITEELFKQTAKETSRNLVVISVDLPTSGYTVNLDYESVSPISLIGNPKFSILPVPIALPALPHPLVIPPGTPIPDFEMRPEQPLLDFVEEFIVRFVEAVDQQVVPVKGKMKAVMGGSLGGNMTFRLGRRPNVPWLPNFIVWSPASIWTSLGEGANIIAHQGPRGGWSSAETARFPQDPNHLLPVNAGRRGEFFGSWDKDTVPGIVPAQSNTWTSDNYLCKRSSVVAARLDRHETYDPKFLSWHWRLGTEQLLYSHISRDPVTKQPRFMANRKPMLIAAGSEDRVFTNDIYGATVNTVPYMIGTPGKAIFLNQTGHSLDNERKAFFAKEILAFLAVKR